MTPEAAGTYDDHYVNARQGSARLVGFAGLHYQGVARRPSLLKAVLHHYEPVRRRLGADINARVVAPTQQVLDEGRLACQPA